MEMVVAICALGREDVYRCVLGLQVHAGRVINGATNTLFGVEHDKQLNVVAITDPLGRQAERYALDRNERIVRVTNLEGQTMTRAYAVSDFVSSETRFDGTQVNYAYDAAGNRLSKTDAGGTVSYTLGVGDRLASWTGGSYSHDTAGCVTRIVRGGDTLNLTWNSQYQLVSVATNGAFAESYAYDALGRRVSTPKQDVAMIKQIRADMKNPPRYNFFF